ncbi:eIF-2-alpha kinase GCN2 isoform X2 [Harmonia axyridis]|uniref:eIF-2-alpha kinase GCN2 isoform X2 n=1 Tax=Harmonia axyridis TaxID=115357 RepID=UPI001E275D3C|nr:eIF-2-alpha kinase GCN2 isoform X2 [Harmonia axyridis]
MAGKPDWRQKIEMSSLMAIYPSLEDLTEGNKKKPIEIRFKFKPSSVEALVGGCLYVVCPLSYPEELPDFKLENIKGLSADNLQQLEKVLLEAAQKKKGGALIYDLCSCFQDFLYEQNDDLLKLKEMEKEKKLKEKQENEERNREKNKQLSLRLNAQQPNCADSTEPPEERNFSEDTDGICSHDSSCTMSIGSRKIIRGKCLEHFGGSNHSIHIGIDKENGKTYNVYEWKLTNFSKNSEQTLKQIKAIEQEFNSGIKTLKHDNLVSYYNILSVRHEDHYIIQTVEEQIRGHNCHTLFIKFKINIGINYIRYIARSVLEALDYLHSKNVVHRDIRSSYVYIEKDNVKVAGYATHRRLSDLVKSKPLMNYNKRKDIQKFGKFILELVSGEPMSDEEDMVVPVSLPLDLCDFLKMCKDEEQQYTTTKLLEHKFLSRESFHFGLGDDESDYPENKYSFEIQKRNFLRKTSTSFDHSRISSEFELVEELGKGAFGSVHKYRNLLDERFYAIKKIQLNTKSKHTIKKIKNEVKLLSRLNHENVVRYYTSWIEEVEVDDRPSSCESEYSLENEEKVKYIPKPEQLTLFDDVEKLAPPSSRNIVSTTYSHLRAQSSSSESESSDEDDDNNGNRSESDGIIFQESEGALNEIEDEVRDSETFETKSTNLKKTYIYIQMEFCENSTLRSAIDNDSLCNDDTRVQRHFREILEGLDYIHKQRMIHRDLKPANIFLDLRKRIKIGDFGLATRNLKSKLIEDHTHKSELDSLIEMGESKTGNIGTFFYVAPEMNTSAKVAYNKKVDVYSLGIILFEMCYKPFPTGMERNSVLLELRKKEVKFPMDYESTLVKKYSAIIRWLLEHEVAKRPTVEDILQSELAPQPILENIELIKMLNYTVSNPQTKLYKSLVANLFQQKMPEINDLSYDLEESFITLNKSVDKYYDLLKEIAVKVFTSHGAKNMATPLLMPFTNNYTFQNNEMCVKLMTQGGQIVSVPCELRVNFARYVAWASLFLFKRYSIDRVFHEQMVFGVSPKTFYECAFDIVTPTPGKYFLPDGEVLHAVYEILKELPVFNNGNVVIHLNHRLLLNAILTYFNIDEGYHSKIIEIFHGREAKNANLEINLANLHLTSSQISSLIGIFFSKQEPGKVPPIIKTIINGKVPESRKYADEALNELTGIMDIAKEMGVEFDICIVPGLFYNVHQFSGMICKFLSKKKNGKWETLAAGGRYDSMIAHYRNLLQNTDFAKDISQSAVGITIFFDKIVAMLKSSSNAPSMKYTDVLVCLEDEWLPHRLVTVLKNLSTLQIEWMLFQTNSRKEADEYGESLGIPHIVMLLKNYNENKLVLKSWNEDRTKYHEKKCNITELIEELKRVIKNNSPAGVSNLSRSESRSYVEKSNNESFSIVFHTPVPSKKRYENQINSKLDDIRERYHGPLVVLALNIEMSEIKQIVGHFDFETEKSFNNSLKNFGVRNSRQKALQEICEFIYEYKSKPNKPFVILYSLIDSSFKFI